MHNHDHHDHHLQMGKKFLYGIILNFSFVLVELWYGWKVNSLSLRADAWHNLGDVAGLIISWVAFVMATKQPTEQYTYGFSKGTILASLANCILLFIAVYSIGSDAFLRIKNPIQTDGNVVSMVAGIGVVINTLTALLFMRSNELNNRAAFLHMIADAFVSLTVVFGGLLMQFGNFPLLDPILGILLSLFILWGTWKLFTGSLKLSLDGVPEGMNASHLKHELLQIPGVKGLNNFHLWAISTTRNAVTVEIIVNGEMNVNQTTIIKEEINSILKSHKIQHTTLEFTANFDQN